MKPAFDLLKKRKAPPTGNKQLKRLKRGGDIDHPRVIDDEVDYEEEKQPVRQAKESRKQISNNRR